MKKRKLKIHPISRLLALLRAGACDHPVEEVSLDFSQATLQADPRITRSVLEGLCIGGFDFDRYKTKKSRNTKPVKVSLVPSKRADISTEVNRAVILGEAL